MAKEKIETLAVLDYLTLLPNRSGLYSFYSGLSIQEYVTAMFLDIDNFKRVNDTYGHQVGDELLKAVTKDLQEIVPDAYIARIGGDEFVILIIGQREKHEILEVAEEICDSVERLAVSPEVRSVISLSVGVLLNEKAETTIDDVLFKSDSAMYYSKKTGKNRYTFYEQIQEEMEFKAKVESSMQQAIKEADAKVVSYHFNGNLDDETGKNSGTVSGEIGYGKGIVDSVGSLKLPGGEQMTNVVHLPKTILGNESYSVSLWVKADRLNNWTSIIMANSNIGFASLIPYGWQKLSMFRIKDTRLDESGGWYDALGEEFYAKEWTHFCATYNSVTGLSRIYQNGRLVGSVDNTLALTNHKIVVLGGDYYKPSFQGEVSELSVYNCVLMENEVKKIYDHYAKDPTFRGKKQ